jgi:ABC-type glutathione transport system ATPase component
LLAHATQSGVGILAISHDIELLARIASRILSMDKGGIIGNVPE